MVAVAKRLDRPEIVSEPVAVKPADAAPSTQAGPAAQSTFANNNIVRLFHAGLIAAGLRFPEKIIEKEFQDYVRERTFAISQFGILLTFIAYVVYGVSDLASDAAIYSTRFRYMVACPLLLMFYGLSFKKFAKKHARIFVAAFAITLSICLYVTVFLLGLETPFQIRTGNGTMNFMLTLGLLALLPLSVVATVWIGAVMVVLHALIMMESHVPLVASWPNYLHVTSMWTIACCIAYWREYQQRRSFAAELT
jgi:hypothetical protein